MEKPGEVFGQNVFSKATMKDWAVERGATHYAHVFFPLTGSTAEQGKRRFQLELGVAGVPMKQPEFTSSGCTSHLPDRLRGPRGDGHAASGDSADLDEVLFGSLLPLDRLPAERAGVVGEHLAGEWVGDLQPGESLRGAAACVLK